MSFDPNLNPQWIESLYLLWKKSPGEVPAGLRALFEGFELGRTSGPPSLEEQLKQSGVQSLIYRYRDIGHLLARTDPLYPGARRHPLLELAAFDLEESDLEKTFHTRRFMKKSATLAEILETMRQTYCRSIGVEFMYIQDPLERQWLIDRMEPERNEPKMTRRQKEEILFKLLEASLFEAFLHRKFLGQKRFSLEGGETLIPLLHSLVQRANGHGVKDMVLGMSHRGRLNVLANIFGKPLENIFAEFADNMEYGLVGEGDVKYHKGCSTDVTPNGGAPTHIMLTSNPSHLEAVDPVVEGKCRARQDRRGAGRSQEVLPVLIHGDAAFAGQGMVAETLNLSQLEGYGTGGTLHLVVNNQIGFTTAPADARSTLYSTDVAKMLAVPIFHVHGEDPEEAAFVTGLALDYRQHFGKDAVIEIICYRRQGHNESDEPAFTQPMMVRRIEDRPPVQELYAGRLVAEGVEEESIERMKARIGARLEKALHGDAKSNDSGYKGRWSGIKREYSPAAVATGVDRETLLGLARRLAAIPEGFAPHPKIKKLLDRRLGAVEEGMGLDWGTAEALAFASLLAEGIPVRLSGQDSRRGTFSHRHSYIYDIESGEAHVPLKTVAAENADYRSYDSMLSEAAVLGFEYGYSLESPEGLTIWEAQFGDFANGAQVIIDQFIAGSETKWDRASGLTLLLPHGYEGQGAEHSSARIERFLQSCANENLLVASPTTPAQLFHLLRRQVKQAFRRPLIVFTPKSLLRHPACVSSVDDLSGSFREILVSGADPSECRSVLLCSGKIYYELSARLQKQKQEEVALIRVEQLYPLSADLLEETLRGFGKAERFAWVQEEPRNAGAWSFIGPRLKKILGAEPEYVGRPESAAPAVGSHRLHTVEQEKILQVAFALP